MNILVSHKNINALVSTIKKQLQILYDWMLANRLTINVVKTSCILFSSDQKRVPLDLFNSGLNIELNGTPINRKDHTKFLVVYIDQNLNWNVHVKHISRTIA